MAPQWVISFTILVHAREQTKTAWGPSLSFFKIVQNTDHGSGHSVEML